MTKNSISELCTAANLVIFLQEQQITFPPL